MSDAGAADREFIVKVGRALQRLMDYEERDDEGEPIGPIIRAHLGEDALGLPVLTEQLESSELPALQLAIDALIARPRWTGRALGLSGEDKRYMALSLSDLVAGEHRRVGPPEFVNAPIGPDETLAASTSP